MLVSTPCIVASYSPCKLTFNTSVLIHPNTNDALRDHTELATWMGPPYPLNVDVLLKRLVV